MQRLLPVAILLQRAFLVLSVGHKPRAHHAEIPSLDTSTTKRLLTFLWKNGTFNRHETPDLQGCRQMNGVAANGLALRPPGAI